MSHREMNDSGALSTARLRDVSDGDDHLDSDLDESETDDDTHASALGTKEYWDTLYAREISNHASNPEDGGTVWFADSDAEERMLAHLRENPNVLDASATDLCVCDVGTGNGHLLFRLREEGYGARMLGLDYSEASVDFCRRLRGDKVGIDFAVWDILQSDDQNWVDRISKAAPGGGAPNGFDLVLDKGTFDAVSLSRPPPSAHEQDVDEDDGVDDELPCRIYAQKIPPLLKPEGHFLIVSCNFTEDELKSWFVGIGGLECVGRIDFPTFHFGGMEGQSCYGLCFCKR